MNNTSYYPICEVILIFHFYFPHFSFTFGGLAQLARAPALQAGGQRFESVILHSADTKVANETANETFNVSTFQPFNFRNRSMTCWENEKLELQI